MIHSPISVCVSSSPRVYSCTDSRRPAWCAGVVLESPAFKDVRWKAESLAFSSSSVLSFGSLKLLSTSRHECGRIDAPGVVAKAALFPFLGGKQKEKIRIELLSAIAPLDRGAKGTPEDFERVDQIARELEKMNPTKEPLTSPLLNGKWKLIYTTSQRSILKTSWPQIFRPSGPIYQAINTATLRAQNLETWPFYNQVTANLEAVSGTKVIVNFDFFKIVGLFSFSRHRNMNLGTTTQISQILTFMHTCVEDNLQENGGDFTELLGGNCETTEHDAPFGLQSEAERIAVQDNNFKWCGLCGRGDGWMMCGSCMGEGRYATRPGLAGVKMRVGWAVCKTCLGRNILPCPLCSMTSEPKLL